MHYCCHKSGGGDVDRVHGGVSELEVGEGGHVHSSAATVALGNLENWTIDILSCQIFL